MIPAGGPLWTGDRRLLALRGIVILDRDADAVGLLLQKRSIRVLEDWQAAV
jgi:hypothetical protein